MAQKCLFPPDGTEQAWLEEPKVVDDYLRANVSTMLTIIISMSYGLIDCGRCLVFN